MFSQHTPERTAATKHTYSPHTALHGFKRKQSSVVAVEEPSLQKVSSSTAALAYDQTANTVTNRLPPNIDPEVFSLLPEEIQMELLSSTNTGCMTSRSSAKVVNVPLKTKSQSTQLFSSHHFNDIQAAESKLEPSDMEATTNQPVGTSTLLGHVLEEKTVSSPQSPDCGFPGNVDPKVFSELPLDVQKELISEWKQQKPIFKIASSKKPGRSLMTKDRKAAGKASQANNLLKYFKPS